MDADHVNFIGRDEVEGPVIISMIEEKEKGTTRALVRLSNKTHHICVENHSSSSPSSSSTHSLSSFPSSPTFFKSALTSPNNVRSILSKINLSTPKKSLKKIKNPNLIKELTTFDQSHVCFFSFIIPPLLPFFLFPLPFSPYSIPSSLSRRIPFLLPQ